MYTDIFIKGSKGFKGIEKTVADQIEMSEFLESKVKSLKLFDYCDYFDMRIISNCMTR